MNGFGNAPAYPSSVAAGASPTSGVATGTAIASTPKAAEIKQGLEARGLPSHVADAFVMNFQDESGLNPGINEKNPIVPGSRGGYGLYQLTGPRRVAYEQFAQQRGVDPSNTDAQLDFLAGELGLPVQGVENLPFFGSEGKAARSILSAPDTATAAQAIVNDFLRPAPEHRAARAAKYAKAGGVQVASLDPSIGITQAGGATIRAGDYGPSSFAGNAPADGARATFGGPQLTYDDGGLRFVDEGAQRVAAQSAPAVAPYDFTGNPQLSAASGMPFQGGQPQQMTALPQQPASQAPAGPSAELLRQNDMAFGGALAPQAQVSQQVADASGYFPPAPSMDRAPVQPQAVPQNNNRLQLLGEVLSNPFVPEEQKRIAQMMFQQEMQQGQEMRQQQAARENWLFQQQYEEAAQARDPLRQAQLIEAQAKVKALQNPDAMLPDSVRALNIRAQQAGLVPGTVEYQQFMISGGKGPLVTVNNGQNGSEFVKKSDEAAAKRFDDIVMAGQTAPQTIADMQQLLDLGTQIGTGKGAQVLAAIGPYADALGIKIDGLNDIQAYEAITSRLAPQMRAVGSGSSSDRDVAMFLQSLPNLRNTQGGNEIIANTMKAVAQNKINAAEIARQAQRGDITWQDADRQISQLPNPYELFKQFQSETQKATGGWNDVGGGVKIRVKP
nr:phage tail tip lysozyme [Ochrobactrum sp. AP1BH01-1]